MAQTRFNTTSGDDTILLKGMPEKINAGAGSDTFIINNSTVRNFKIDGGTNSQGTDLVLNPVYFSGTSLSTVKTTLGMPNAIDRIQFNKTGVFTEFEFTGIEQIDLDDGITVTLSNEQLETAMESLEFNGMNAGLHFYGVAGGQTETLRVIIEYEEHTFTPVITVKGAIPVAYTMGNFQLDDAATGDLFHDVLNYMDFYKESLPDEDDDDEEESGEEDDDGDEDPLAEDLAILEAIANKGKVSDDDDDNDDVEASEEDDDDDNEESDNDDDAEEHDEDVIQFYARADGSNNDDFGLGSRGVDYATLRLGNDTYFGHEGNDLLVGHQGADLLSGGKGDDIFLITSFGGALGAAGKADDGNPEWIEGDIIIGGAGIDTLRITGGAAVKTTVELTDDNFQSMEVVEIGSTVGRLNVEDSALQLMNTHYYLNTGGKIEGKDLRTGQTVDNVIIDASDIEANGLKFIGNGNNNTFIGTQKDDTFIGNGGNDKLTGGAGADKFVFGAVVTQIISGDATTIQQYEEVETDLTGVDTITDFKKSGADKIVLDAEMFSALEEGLAEENFVIGIKAKDADDYLIFNPTTQTLSYDTDGNGKGEAIDIVMLLGVKTLSVTNFIIE